eukprot:15784-Rhodomonas_salina.1
MLVPGLKLVVLWSRMSVVLRRSMFVPGLKLSLYRHQRRALEWMLQRGSGRYLPTPPTPCSAAIRLRRRYPALPSIDLAAPVPARHCPVQS